jgi:tetratricopeptide (TPR) repeat protein
MVCSVWLVALMAITQGAAPAPATPDTIARAYDLFLQGRTLESEGDATGALAAYKQALETAPQSAEIHAELSGLYARQGKPADAESEARAALALDGTDREAHRTLGLVLAERANNTPDAVRSAALTIEAIGHLERALEDRIVDPLPQLTLGRLYGESGQAAKAIQALELFLLDHPGYPDAIVALAKAYDADHKPDEAADLLQGFVTDQPDQLAGWLALAQVDEERHRWMDAASAWGELARRVPRSLAYRTRQATALVNGGDFAAARQALLAITQAAPREIGPWYLLAQAEERAGDPAAAAQAARKIIEIDPKDPRGPLALAGAEAAQHDYHAAVATLDPFVASPRPEDIVSGVYGRMAGALADALEATNDSARAVKVLEEARRRDAQNTDLAIDLAEAYRHAGEFDRAETTLREVVTSEPTNADALNSLGYLLADRGKKLDEAVSLIKRALEIDADNPSFLDSLGWAYFKQSKFDNARVPLQRAASALPKASVIQDHLAELYFRLKLYPEAAATWDLALAGDRSGVDAATVTKKRDRARQLAGK